ncbi:MAG: hypothetical protein M1837_001863 [Sclerophora amabilis]|nr:MAG: hypothetical protein M1837_001863 [Sclerophora amabilis]
MSTLRQFLSGIAKSLVSKDAAELQRYILVEPPLPEIYSKLTSELRRDFPRGNGNALEDTCTELLPEDDGTGGTSWPSFVFFIKEYLEYLRDVNVDNLLETHQLLSGLVNLCISALSNASMGIVVLPTCLSLSAILARLAVGLDKRPDLTAHLVQSLVDAGDEPKPRRTLVEGTAELLQRAFTTCLTDRTANTSGVDGNGQPEGKKIGIYSFANLVLKLLFQCRKTRLASQIFANVAQQSPHLSAFPASHRVTYLYYLGRFALSNNHFYRAQKALHAAYDQCHAQYHRQRYRILIYLVTVNIILGRLPSEKLVQRPEMIDLWVKFKPLCEAIKRGDLCSIRATLNGKDRDWFLNKGILLPLQNRCEILVWRSLARKAFLFNGVHGGESRKASTFSLHDLLVLFQTLERRSLGLPPMSSTALTNGRIHTNSIFMSKPSQPTVKDYVDADLDDVEGQDSDTSLSTMLDVESILVSLIDQGLLHGFIGRKQLRFAILGAKAKGALSAGFPNVWDVEQSRAVARGEEDSVPGWVTDDRKAAIANGGLFGAGRVVNLSGARPAGAPLA